ncbi:6-phosphogluconolactonase, eukaryotic type [hydrothermal vent metagenome]|uniref:6-phosphogluconolactonase, eukaryotic type n=1 Tax=hydrothermal vent metagenome TaxID=652676 RepID=A0A3B1C7S0_9ZZZZ
MDAKNNICVSESVDAAAKAAAEFWAQCAVAAIQDRGAFYIAFSGGSTPQYLHRYLLMDEYREKIDWSRVHAFFGDERMVARDHPDSNYRMVRETLLSHVDIPEANIYPVVDDALLASLEPAQSAAMLAANYAKVLEQRLPHDEHGRITFDLVMLGMGADGHTASLFPGTSILDERTRSVAEVYVEKLTAWRVSLTFPVIEQAQQRLLLICGEDKAEVLAKVFASTDKHDYPVKRFASLPRSEWFLDQAAASKLEQA